MFTQLISLFIFNIQYVFVDLVSIWLTIVKMHQIADNAYIDGMVSVLKILQRFNWEPPEPGFCCFNGCNAEIYDSESS